MDRYFIAGNPVAHSRSPFIHAAFARQTGQELVYDRLLVPMGGFAAAIGSLAAGGARGCNVTVPFKFDAFELAAHRTERSSLAGAANALRFEAHGWLADNTDGAGLVADIERNAGVALVGARVLLIGAGGAAAGALGPLLLAGTAEVVVANRTFEKAQALVDRHCGWVAGSLLRAATLDGCGRDFDVVVNASASSLQGASVPVSPVVLAPDALALDMMYGPAAKPFLDWAEAHGARARDGLGMLVEQAAEAFVWWRGVRPETAAVLAALRERMNAEGPAP